MGRRSFTSRLRTGAPKKEARERRRTGLVWICSGVGLIALTLTMALAHYVLDAPIVDRATGQPATPGAILVTFLMFGAAGALSILTGVLRGRAPD